MSVFQSTRPVRGATITPVSGAQMPLVSIHAPRAGRDRGATCRPCRPGTCFNPRAPCGARPQMAFFRKTDADVFQSTRPVRGATVELCVRAEIGEFQSTRPVRGATWRTWGT